MTRAKHIVASAGALALAVAAAAWIAPSPAESRAAAAPVPFAPKSLGQMAFGPGHVLFIGDNDAAAIHAVTGIETTQPSGRISIDGIDAKIAQVLGTTPQEIAIIDMAVHPKTESVYLTVRRGTAADARWVLLRVRNDPNRPIEEVQLNATQVESVAIPNAPAANPAARRDPRAMTITDLGFADGRLWIAGLSNEQFSSAFRRISYPFSPGRVPQTSTLEIYHVSHGKSETQAPVMTFAPITINGALQMVAAYTCTPLVAFDARTFTSGAHVVGRTVAELGAGNQPLDMISYNDRGTEVILIANSRHALMKLGVADVASGAALTTPDQEGIARKPVSAPGAITQLADLNGGYVVVIERGANGLNLKSIAKSTL